jgi:hypothetical protein
MSKDLPIYKITIDPEYSDGEDLGIEQIAFTSTPAIKVKGMAFNQAQSFFFADATKYRIVAPAMIPMEIYRRDDESGEYYVQFTEEVIEQIYTKFMRDLNNRNLFNLEHETERTVPAYILESWIVEKPKEDKAYTSYGIEVPKGTLMLTAQVTDVDYYEKLVKDEQIGFSIEGFLGLKLSNQIKLNTMKLPDGEHLIEGKFYTIEGGEVIEVKEQEMAEDVVEEEVKEETTEEPTEEVVEEAMAVDPATDAEAILAVVKPLIAEQVDSLLAIIADLKNQVEERIMEKEEEEEVIEEVKMSAFDKFKAFRNTFKNQ